MAGRTSVGSTKETKKQARDPENQIQLEISYKMIVFSLKTDEQVPVW